MKKHPVIVYWITIGKTEYFDSIKDCAFALRTSTSQVKRLLTSGKYHFNGQEYCSLEDAIK